MLSHPVSNPRQEAPASRAGEASDHSLLRRLRHGNQDAATQLYLRYARRLHALVRANCSTELSRRVDPDDIVQSVFRRFFRRALQGEYDAPPGEELWGLFLVIALNKIRAEETFHRAGRRDVRLTVGGSDRDRRLREQAGADEVGYATLQLTIEEGLQSFSAAQRQMVELRIEGHDVAEIARRTRRSRRSVERGLQEARKRLRALLGKEDSP